ncbi:MAG TPA: helix-hairpin-helix domain-containing protein [Pelobium sp.]
MYKKIRQYIEISPREFRGMFVFIIILAFIVSLPYLIDRIAGQPLEISIETLTPKIAEIESFNEKKNSFYDENNKEAKSALFDFDPNNLPVEKWEKLGLSVKQAQSIKRYEAKGGIFKTVADVKKMYAISPEMFERLAPYIKIPAAKNELESYPKTKETHAAKPTLIVELNGADSVSLLAIRGIGPSFASRILKYRNKLGGFISANQLKEVYGIDSIKFQQLLPQITIDAKSIKKIQINKCSLDDIRYFPYLGYKQANAIIAYRKQHGDFTAAKDLNKIAILTPELVQKITPYLNFND